MITAELHLFKKNRAPELAGLYEFEKFTPSLYRGFIRHMESLADDGTIPKIYFFHGNGNFPFDCVRLEKRSVDTGEAFVEIFRGVTDSRPYNWYLTEA